MTTAVLSQDTRAVGRGRPGVRWTFASSPRLALRPGRMWSLLVTGIDDAMRTVFGSVLVKGRVRGERLLHARVACVSVISLPRPEEPIA